MSEQAPVKLNRRELFKMGIEYAKKTAFVAGDLGVVVGGISLGMAGRRHFEAQDAYDKTRTHYAPFYPGSGIYTIATPTPGVNKEALIEQSEQLNKSASNWFRTALYGGTLTIPALVLVLKELGKWVEKNS